MINIYQNKGTKQIYVDENTGRTLTIDLPSGLDANEVAFVIQTDTMRAIIQNVLGKCEQV